MSVLHMLDMMPLSWQGSLLMLTPPPPLMLAKLPRAVLPCCCRQAALQPCQSLAATAGRTTTDHMHDISHKLQGLRSERRGPVNTWPVHVQRV
jgi:hypothetical protein